MHNTSIMVVCQLTKIWRNKMYAPVSHYILNASEISHFSAKH